MSIYLGTSQVHFTVRDKSEEILSNIYGYTRFDMLNLNEIVSRSERQRKMTITSILLLTVEIRLFLMLFVFRRFFAQNLIKIDKKMIFLISSMSSIE